MIRHRCAFLVILVAQAMPAGAAEAIKRELRYAPAPVDNPLKGLVPYAGDVRERFPHSLEFNYLPLAALVVGKSAYDWAPLEKLLGEIAGRGHQAVFRIYLEYPGKKNAIPEYLVTGGLKIHKYLNTNTHPFPPQEVETPDYSDRNLRQCLREFIAALGKKYDGDPRIGFITAGLLGTWGEWHTYPRNELWASKDVQTEVLDAYEAAFRVTPILLRYPAGADHYAQAPNAGRRFGYHDDSFAWATLDTGRPEDDWFFLPAMKAAGPKALDAWKQHPIGGEIRPEAWSKVFDTDPGDKQIQDFSRCVAETHVTWLMDSGMFEKPQPADRRKRAEEAVRKMGYEFHVRSVLLRQQGRSLEVTVELENRGVAPFYYDWPVEFVLLSPTGKMIQTFRGQSKLPGLLPAAAPRVWQERFDSSAVAAGNYLLAVGVRNRLPGGIPLRFANETQDQHVPGWLTLAAVELP